MTSVEIPDVGGMLLVGHVSLDAALAEARTYYLAQQAEATLALRALERGNVHVFHQTGVHIAHRRREVTA
jgi:hypothetical protein